MKITKKSGRSDMRLGSTSPFFLIPWGSDGFVQTSPGQNNPLSPSKS